MGVLLLAVLALLPQRTFYVDPGGNDGDDGLSKAHAWRTLDRVSRSGFNPGDTVLLSAGARFEGNITLAKGGAPSRPVVIRSAPKNPAIIESHDKPAIVIRCGDIEVRGLKLVGGATKSVKGHVGLLMSAPARGPYSHIRISDVDISGFGADGISIVCDKGSTHGFSDVSIDRALVHGNYGTGIGSDDGTAYLDKGYSHKNLRITDCDVSDNPGGNGIILSGVDGALVEYCRAANNRLAGGSLGMWCWCARDVVFRYCIASGTRGKADSGGFDLDGGSRDCRAEKCLSYDNDGPGFMHCDYPWAPRTEHNVFEDCVSIDDGRRGGDQAIGFGYVVWGSGLYDCVVRHNLAVLTAPVPGAKNGGMLFATFIRSEEMPIDKQRLDGALFYGNTVVAGVGAAYVRNNFPTRHEGDVRFMENRYGGGIAHGFVEGPDSKPVSMDQEQWSGKYGSDTGRPPTVKIGPYRSLRPRDLPAFLRSIHW